MLKIKNIEFMFTFLDNKYYRIYLNDNFNDKYKDYVMKKDYSDNYYDDGYCIDYDYNKQTGEVMYIGDNEFVSVRLLNDYENKIIYYIINNLKNDL